MQKREILKMASLSLLVPVASSGVQQTYPKNILFIAVDDLKPVLGCYGHEQIKTPNIDRLARAGTVFLNNHCQMAVCGPSRASLMTGLRPDRTEVWDLRTLIRDRNPDALTLPQYLRSQGFITTGVGKVFDSRSVDGDADKVSWSLPFVSWMKYEYPEDIPPPIFCAWQSPRMKELLQKAQAEGVKNLRGFMSKHGEWKSTEALQMPDQAYPDGVTAEKGVQLLRTLSKEKDPFFVAVGFIKPHLPFAAPKKYWDLYDRDDFVIHPYQKKSTDPVSFAYHSSGELCSYGDIPKFDSFSSDPERWLSEEKQKELIHGYYACVSYVDAQIGLLLDELEKTGLEKRTVVVLWGDHGWHLGDHGMWCKHSNFEQATRSPLIVSSPQFAGGGETDAPTEFVDVFPTLCELAGMAVPDHLDGTSLVPLMKNPADSVKDFAVSQWPVKEVMGYALRDKRYRYVEWIENGDSRKPYQSGRVRGRELYDYVRDPEERVNVAEAPQYRDVRILMEKRMRRFFEEQQHKQQKTGKGAKMKNQVMSVGVAAMLCGGVSAENYNKPLTDNWQTLGLWNMDAVSTLSDGKKIVKDAVTVETKHSRHNMHLTLYDGDQESGWGATMVESMPGFGEALQLDGVNDLITGIDRFPVKESFVFECWINIGRKTGENIWLVDMPEVWWLTLENDCTRINLYVKDTEGKIHRLKKAINPHAGWQHITAGFRDGTLVLQVLGGDGGTLQVGQPLNNEFNVRRMTIGARMNRTGFFKGLMDDIRLSWPGAEEP